MMETKVFVPAMTFEKESNFVSHSEIFLSTLFSLNIQYYQVSFRQKKPLTDNDKLTATPLPAPEQHHLPFDL